MTLLCLASLAAPPAAITGSLPASGANLWMLLFPAALFVFYLICWLLVGRDPRITNVVPQYEPPAGISAGAARYILTGGSDGTTLAAVLASLAAKNAISIDPQNGKYLLRLVRQSVTVAPEEAALTRRLFNVELASSGAPSTGKAVTSWAGAGAASSAAAIAAQMFSSTSGELELDPKNREQVKFALDAIQEALRTNYAGRFFRWNIRFVLLGVAATFFWALWMSANVPSTGAPTMPLTFWLLFFTTLAGIVIGGYVSSRPAHPTFGQRILIVVLPLFFFALPGLFIYLAGPPSAPLLAPALLAAVALNSIFSVVLRAPTREGQKVKEQLAGFREFLVRVEQDRYDRLNAPMNKAELMDRYLPYAIALGVKEGWGDTMAASFSNAVVER